MSVGASGGREPLPVDSTRLDPTTWMEPAPPDQSGFTAYPGASAYPGATAYPMTPAQYPPPYPDLGTGPSPTVYPPPVYAPYASYPPYGYPATQQTNTLAIVALVISFFFWPVGLVCGHIARRQIAHSGESGRGLATAALVIGYLQFAFIALLIFVGIASS